MSVIVPAVLPKSRDDLESKLARLDGLVESVQVDIIDGHFASPASWPYSAESAEPIPGQETLPYLGHFNFELDLMVADPEVVAGAWIDHGITRLTLHAESARDLAQLLETLHTGYGHDKGFAPDLLSLGLAISISTPLSVIEPYLDQVDYVQFMGIATIGRQGEPFEPKILQQVKAFRKAFPDMPVQVDGGVNLTTAPQLMDAGVTRLIIGSGLWKAPNLREELLKYKQLAEEYGIYE